MCNHYARNNSGSFLTFTSLSLIIFVSIMQHFEEFPYVTVKNIISPFWQMRLLTAPQMSTEGFVSMALCSQNWFSKHFETPFPKELPNYAGPGKEEARWQLTYLD